MIWICLPVRCERNMGLCCVGPCLLTGLIGVHKGHWLRFLGLGWACWPLGICVAEIVLGFGPGIAKNGLFTKTKPGSASSVESHFASTPTPALVVSQIAGDRRTDAPATAKAAPNWQPSPPDHGLRLFPSVHRCSAQLPRPPLSCRRKGTELASTHKPYRPFFFLPFRFKSGLWCCRSRTRGLGARAILECLIGSLCWFLTVWTT